MKMAILVKVIHRFNTIPIKLPMIFTELEKTTLNFIWNQKRAHIAKSILSKKNKAGGITLPDFKLHCKATVMKTGSLPYTLCNINSRWIKDLSIRPNIIKTLEENLGNTILNIGTSKDFMPKAIATKTKIGKWNLITLKSKRHYQHSEQTTYRMEEDSANYTSDKGLISSIDKKLKQIYKKNTSNTIKKWAKDMTKHFSKEDIHVTNNRVKRKLNIDY